MGTCLSQDPVGRLEDTLRKSVLSFHSVGSQGSTQVIRSSHQPLPVFESGSHVGWAHFKNHCGAKDDLELIILLPPLPECWDYRYILPCPAGVQYSYALPVLGWDGLLAQELLPQLFSLLSILLTKWSLWGPAVNTASSCLFLDLLVSVQMMTTLALCALLGSHLYVTPALSHALQQFFTERIC